MRNTQIQGALVVVDGTGVLIRGRPGSGKSLAALGLMDRGHHLVADDLVEISAGTDGRPVGTAVEEDVRMEIRGLGIFKAQALYPSGTAPFSPIHFIVELDEYEPGSDAGRTRPDIATTRVMGCELLQVRLPVPRGADPAMLIELLARVFRTHGTVTTE